jgi:hypothetical protein
MEAMAQLEFVDLPSYNMVDLSVGFWDCLPEAIRFLNYEWFSK